MSNLILHPDASNGAAHGTTSVRNDESALSEIVKQAEAALPALGPDVLTTWVSFALMTGHLAFPVCVAIVALADLINAVASAAFRARLVDVQVFLQKRTSRAASGLEGIYGVLLDVDHRVSGALTDVDSAGAPVPAVHWHTPRPGMKLGYVWPTPVSEPVFVETAMRLGLHFDHIDPRSWTTSQGQRLPTVIRRDDGRLTEVQHTAYLANATPLSGVVSDVPFPGRVRFALGGSLVSPAQRNEIRAFLESIGIPAPEGPGSHRYRACPDCEDHSTECCYVNVADDGAISVVCLAGHGGEGNRTWNEALLLTLATNEPLAHATRFDLLKDLPVTWSAIALIHHMLSAWPSEEQDAVVRVWMAEKARLESPAPEKANEMLGVYLRRLRGEGHFGPVHLYFDARAGGLKYADAAGRTYAINCTAAGPTTKGNAHECGATAAKTLVFDAESGAITVGWAPLTPSLLNKAVVGQRHALGVLGVPVIERHEMPVAFDEEEWSVEPKTKIVIAKIPFRFPEGVEPIPALEFFLRIYREGRLPFATENDVRLFVVAIAAPLLRYAAPGLLGVFWFVGPPGAGKDYLAEIPSIIWASVNAFVTAVKFDISVTDDLEQKRSLASAGDAVYGRAKEAGKRPGFVDLLIRFAGTESLPARQVYAPELTVKNTYTILADSAEDIPDRREISRRTIMISVAEIADSISKGKVLDEIRAAAPGLLLDLLQRVESQPLTAYTQVANANTRPIVPVALARLFGAELPEVRGEDLTDIFDAMLEFVLGATGKVEGESERKKAMKRADRESKDAIMIPSYRLSFFIDTVSAQPGYRELFGKYRDKAKELLNRIVREAGYADVRAHKLPYLTVRIGDTPYAFKFVRNNRNFILIAATEYVDRMAGIANAAASSSVAPTTAAAIEPASAATTPSGSVPAETATEFEDGDVLERIG